MAIDPKLLEDLRERQKVATEAGGVEKLKKRKDKGLMGARERLETFFQPGTFQEFGMHAQHTCTRFGMDKKKLPYDGVVCGTGLVDGRAVAAYAQDFTVSGGSLG
ncbi:MAG: carboxyl transferase domain-containing protein, partial [Coraliomargarita sp.]